MLKEVICAMAKIIIITYIVSVHSSPYLTVYACNLSKFCLRVPTSHKIQIYDLPNECRRFGIYSMHGYLFVYVYAYAF